VHQRFDPSYYENYVGLLSKLTQTGSVMEYQSSFEALLNKVTGVPEATLVAMYVAGLKQPIQREVNLQGPTTLAATFALAREVSACHQESVASLPHRTWATRFSPGQSSSPSSAGLLPTPTTAARPSPFPARTADKATNPPLPVVRLSATEKAERNKKGLCWYCDEKWIPGYNCKHRFLVLMGPEDDEEEPVPADPTPLDGEASLITADISSIHSLSGSPSPRALKLAGSVNNTPVQVLLDSGSTHNFIHPKVAEHLALVLQPVTPFRVYVGNGDSLRCAYACPQTPLLLQGHLFPVDLYLLEVHGLDIVLGIQWLQTLGCVSHDYGRMTMEFLWQGQTVTLRGDLPGPKPISYGHLCSLASTTEKVEFYEII
ncbi:unnamed protein product, partial [Cuscuta campestris]